MKGINFRRLNVEQDGVPGWLAHPKDTDKRRPAVLVLHHAPGLTGDYKSNAALLAELGYVVMVPSLFNMLGVAGDNHYGQGQEIQSKYGDKEFLEIIDQSWRWIVGRPEVDPARVAVVGHCMGGRLAIPFAADTPSVKALVLFYATIRDDKATTMRPRHSFDTAKLVKCPTQVFYGGKDFLTTPVTQRRLWQSFVDGGAPLEWHYFSEGTHGYANSDSAEYQPERSMLSWQMTCDFLGRTLF